MRQALDRRYSQFIIADTAMTYAQYGLDEFDLGKNETAPTGFMLTAGDIEILRLVYEHRFLRREQLSRLIGRHAKRLHRRLLKLARSNYLMTIRLPQQKHIYGLGKVGIPILVEQGIGSPDVMGKRLRTNELKPLFLNHEMMIVDVHVALTIVSKNSHARLVDWREGRELFDTVLIVDHKGSASSPVRPDAFFSLEDSRRPAEANRTHFALEVDRSTESQPRFEEKIRANWHYIEQGLHARKYEIKGLRVLTVAVTNARARNLCSLAAKVVPNRAKKYFLFASLNDFSPENSELISGATCYSPRTVGIDQRHPLIPPPDPLHKESTML